MRNSNRVFGAHDKIIWSTKKIDYAHRNVRTEAGKISEKSL